MSYKNYLAIHLLMHTYQWYTERQTSSYIPYVNPVASQVNAVNGLREILKNMNGKLYDQFMSAVPKIISDQMPENINRKRLISHADELASWYFPKASQDVSKLAYTRRHPSGVSSGVQTFENANNDWALFGIPVSYLLDAEIPMDLRQAALSRAYLRITSAGGGQ